MADQNPGECPICHNYNLEYGTSQPQDEGYFYLWKCSTCGTTGKEWYYMEFVEHSIIQRGKKKEKK